LQGCQDQWSRSAFCRISSGQLEPALRQSAGSAEINATSDKEILFRLHTCCRISFAYLHTWMLLASKVRERNIFFQRWLGFPFK
jgi:hypothetical protein